RTRVGKTLTMKKTTTQERCFADCAKTGPSPESCSRGAARNGWFGFPRAVTRCRPSISCGLAKPDEGVSHMSNASPMTAYRSYSVARAAVGGYSHYQKRSATPSAAITVCIVSDNRVACELLTSMLEQVPDLRPFASTDGDPARLVDANAQVLVLDAELQESVQHVVALKNAYPDAKVVVMDLGVSPADIGEFVKAGASGFILKDADFDEFVGTIRQVAGGKTVLPPRVTTSLLSGMTRAADGSREKRLVRKVSM